jgi:hypothetical protein
MMNDDHRQDTALQISGGIVARLGRHLLMAFLDDQQLASLN